MKRQEFIKNSLVAAIGLTLVPSIFISCEKSNDIPETENGLTKSNDRSSVKEFPLNTNFNYIVVSNYSHKADQFFAERFKCEDILDCTVVKLIKVKKRESFKARFTKPVILGDLNPKKGCKHFTYKIYTETHEFIVTDFLKDPKHMKFPSAPDGLIKASLKSKIITEKDAYNYLPKEISDFLQNSRLS